MMDAIKSFFVWPIYILQAYTVLVIGWTLAIIPFLIHLVTKGRKSFALFTDIFTFCSKLPLGVHVFSSIIYLTAPYSGSICSTTRYLAREGDIVSSVLTMEDRPWLRNPFGSIHAVALSNLGELASGICVVSAMQHSKGIKGIPVRIDTSYHHKARGTISARSQVSLKQLQESIGGEYKATTTFIDEKGVTVATCCVSWSCKSVEKGSMDPRKSAKSD